MLKTLAKCVRQYKKVTLLTPVFITMEVLCEVAIPFLMATLIDKGIDAGNMEEILKMGGILLLLAMVSLFFGILAGKSSAAATAGFACNLRHDLFYKVQDFSFANIDKFSTGGIITRLTTDVTNVQMAFLMIIRVAVRFPTMLTFALIMSFSINSTLASIFLLTIPILALGLYIIIRNAHPIFTRVFRSYDHLNNVVEEDLRGIRVVKSFVREKFEISKFARVSQAIYKDFSKAERLISFNMPLMMFCAYFCMLLVAWIGARLIVSNAMTTGQLVSLISYAMQILVSLMMLSMVFVIITISKASIVRIAGILSEQPDLVNPANPVMEVADGSVRFEDVAFSYGKDPQKQSLKNANLNIASGQTIGVIGGTGAAKTTLVQLIPRLYDTTHGRVLVGGRDVREYDLQALRNAVAMVLQKNTLFSGSIKENLRWGDENATDEQLIEACKLAQAHEFIMAFPKGYDTYIEQGGTNVSGGQKQRLAIARALLKKPKILILDDSTSAVDTATDASIRRAFREKIPDTTKIIIAQRIASVQDADLIVVLEGGMIDDAGTHGELMARNPIYREVYESQMKGGEEDEA